VKEQAVCQRLANRYTDRQRVRTTWVRSRPSTARMRHAARRRCARPRWRNAAGRWRIPSPPDPGSA